MIDVREARADDYDVYQRLFPELGVDEGVPSRERFTTDLATRMFVAIDAEQVVGYLLFDLMDGVGYVRNVVSDPERRRAGIGIALMEAARERFVRAGATTWCLNVKAENRAAIALYERCGMGLHYRTTVLRLPRSVSLPPVDPSLSLVPVPPEADPMIEPAFALLPGQLASARNKAGRMVLQLARGDEVLGVGVFVPSVPGSFPFRLARGRVPRVVARARPRRRRVRPDRRRERRGARRGGPRARSPRPARAASHARFARVANVIEAVPRTRRRASPRTPAFRRAASTSVACR